jgi:gamma-tubulin complex component 5
LPNVFFGADGSLSTFNEALFARIRHTGNAGFDSFMLTELAHVTICSALHTDPHALRLINTGHGSDVASSVVRRLRQLTLKYAIAWPVQNITRTDDLASHAVVFSFLLQVQYCKQLLSPHLLDLRPFQHLTQKINGHVRATLSLRSRLLSFLAILHDHVTCTAKALHSNMLAAMKAAADIDEMAAAWSTYETQLQMGLLVAPRLSPIRDAVTGILELCERFATAWESLLAGRQTDNLTSNMERELEKSTAFVIAGVRGVSRAGGQLALESFAERLAWSRGNKT